MSIWQRIGHINWKREPVLLVGQVKALLFIGAAAGLELTDHQTAAIVGAAGAVAAVIGSFIASSGTVPAADARDGTDDMMRALFSAPPPDPSQGIVMNKPYGLHPMAEMPRIPALDEIEGASVSDDELGAGAVGVHQHDRYKLGLAGHGRPDTELLHMGWVDATPPASPPTVDRLSQLQTDALGNDKFGDCEEAACANSDAVNTRYLIGTELDHTTAEVLALYAASTRPPFDPATGANDNGTDMVSGMKALQKAGIGGRKIVAYAKLKDTTDPSIMAAIDLFGSVVFAVTLQTAQQTQTDLGVWDYKPSGVWGGHAIVAGAYVKSTGRITVRTWGRNVDTTTKFRAEQLDEVWVPIWPELLSTPGFEKNVDQVSLAADFAVLTGGVLPVQPTPAPPGPGPAPGPVPGPDPDASFLAAFDTAYPGTVAWATARAAHRSKATGTAMTPGQYLRWLVAGEAGTRAHAGDPS